MCFCAEDHYANLVFAFIDCDFGFDSCLCRSLLTFASYTYGLMILNTSIEIDFHDIGKMVFGLFRQCIKTH